MKIDIEDSWKKVLFEEFEKPYFQSLQMFVDSAYEKLEVYPSKEKIFNAFNLTSFDNVKVVILGQDPYHEPNQAQGLAFYVPDEIKAPPSLVNIAKELRSDLSITKEIQRPDLLSWAKQGVFLLNATLTVEAHKAASHQGKGWEIFTDAVINALANRKEHLVFILWGSSAQKKGAFIDREKHLVIESKHPSPLSAYRGFFGSAPFSRTNAYLRQYNLPTISWL